MKPTEPEKPVVWYPIGSMTELVRHLLNYGLRPEEAWEKANSFGQMASGADYRAARALVDERLASWRAIVDAYRQPSKDKKPPTQLVLAGRLGISEDTLRVRLRTLHRIDRYNDIHARIALEP